MTTDQTRRIVQHIMERLDARDLEGSCTYYTGDTIFHGFAPEPLNLLAYRGVMSMFLSAYPDSRFPVDEIIAEGEAAAVRHSLRGTHRGEIFGVPASGNPVVVPATATFHVAGGKVTEVWLNADLLGMMTQIGAVPAPATA